MKKGFTVVELLSILIVLAILAIIAIPKLLKVVNSSRETGAENSAIGYVRAVEEKLIADQFDAPLIKNGAYYVDDTKISGLNVKGKLPQDGWVVINDGDIIEAELLFDKVVVEFDGKKARTNKEKTTPSDIEEAE